MSHRIMEHALIEKPDCTHVLYRPETAGSVVLEYVPAYITGQLYFAVKNPQVGDTVYALQDGWSVAFDNTAQLTADQLVTAARFDQAASSDTVTATDRQIGGDHYKSLKIQPIEYIDANNMPYLEGNVVKYVTRHASKNGVQDIDKAIHYLELIKQMRYAEDNTSDK